jgi:predicted nucleotidyltransferase
MQQLAPSQRELVALLAARLGAIAGVAAVVLGGSHARGRARPDSDIDLGLFYSESSPFSIEAIRELAQSLNDTPAPVVTAFYEWGPWVNGGAWLTIAGQRVDFLYRSLERWEQVMAEAETGRYELCFGQQPAFGFFSATYLGEMDICVPLFDPKGRIPPLKRRVAEYPEALRRAVVQDYLSSSEGDLHGCGTKFAKREDSYLTAALLARSVNSLILALFALNRRYPLNDKTALIEIGEFDRAPRDFAARVQSTLSHVGTSAAELIDSVERIVELSREAAALSEGLYRPRD